MYLIGGWNSHDDRTSRPGSRFVGVAVIPLAARTTAGMARLVDALKALPSGPSTIAAPLTRLANNLLADVASQPVRGAFLSDGESSWSQASASSATPVWFAFGGTAFIKRQTLVFNACKQDIPGPSQAQFSPKLTMLCREWQPMGRNGT